MRVSVVIPAFDAERTLPALLDELQKQCGTSVEIIVVDDGSTDGTSKAALRERVRLLRQPNAGPAAARNAGAAMATGDILLFLDSDLVPTDRFVETMVASFADPTIAAVQGTMTTRQSQWIARYSQAEIDYKQRRCRRQRFVDSISAGMFAIRRPVFESFGGFCEQFRMAAAEDTDLSFRMARAGRRIQFCPEAVVVHPQPASLTAYVRLKLWRGYWRALLYRRHPHKVVSDSYTSQLQKVQVIGVLLSPLLVPLAFWWAGLPALYMALGAAAITTLPATVGIAAGSGWRAALITPPMQLLSSSTLACGLVAGVLSEVLGFRRAPNRHTAPSRTESAQAGAGASM